jgi:hypothetical protein
LYWEFRFPVDGFVARMCRTFWHFDNFAGYVVLVGGIGAARGDTNTKFGAGDNCGGRGRNLTPCCGRPGGRDFLPWTESSYVKWCTFSTNHRSGYPDFSLGGVRVCGIGSRVLLVYGICKAKRGGNFWLIDWWDWQRSASQ